MAHLDVYHQRLQQMLGLAPGVSIRGAEWILDTASVRFHLIGGEPVQEDDNARVSQSEKRPSRKRQE